MLKRLVRIVKAYDVFLNNVYLPHPKMGQTISLNSARSAENDEEWACILCGLLNYLVQRGHCKLTLTNKPMTTLALFRAGLVLTGVAVVHIVAVYFLIALCIVLA